MNKNSNFIWSLCRNCSTELVTIPRIIDTIVADTFKITCMARNSKDDQYRNWKECKWERISDNSSCHFRYHKISGKDEYEVFDKCLGLNDHYFFGDEGLFKGEGNPYCGLSVNPTSIHDQGDWRCTMIFEDPKNHSECKAETMTWAKVKLQIRNLKQYFVMLHL